MTILFFCYFLKSTKVHRSRTLAYITVSVKSKINDTSSFPRTPTPAFSFHDSTVLGNL